MKKLIFGLVLLVSGFVNSQESVYGIGEDGVTWVLYSGERDLEFEQYQKEDLGNIIPPLTRKMIDSMEVYFNDSLIDLYDPSNGQHPYTRLNTELVYESVITQEEWYGESNDPYDDIFFQRFLDEFKDSGFRFDGSVRYLVTFEIEAHYEYGSILDGNIAYPETYLLLRIRRVW